MTSAYAVNYGAVAIAGVLALLFALFLVFLGRLLAPRQLSELKAIAYECGILPWGRYWTQLYVRYYLFGILFLIFDVEVAFLFPWALVFDRLGVFAFYEMVLFIAILLFGLAYAWRKGVLRWE